MTAFPNANDLLMGAGVASVSWDRVPVGTIVTGTITAEPTVSQQTDMVKKIAKWYDKEETQPMLQIVVQMQTELRDPAKPEDTGLRSLYVKGQMRTAVAEAVRASGAPGFQVGGKLTVRFIGEGEASSPAMNPPKHYDAAYVPAPSAASSALMGGLAPLDATAPVATQAASAPISPLSTPSVAAAALAAQQAAATVPATGIDPALLASLQGNPALLAALSAAAAQPAI